MGVLYDLGSHRSDKRAPGHGRDGLTIPFCGRAELLVQRRGYAESEEGFAIMLCHDRRNYVRQRARGPRTIYGTR
jgi:hypothetical protein